MAWLRRWVAAVSIAAAAGGLSAAPALAQQNQESLKRFQSMAGACAFAPMPAKDRLDACDMLLSQPGLTPQVQALARLGRAQALRRAGDGDAADAELDRAIALAPNLSPAYLARGAARLRSRDHAGAIADASEAIELNRRNPAGYLLRAEAYLNQGQAAFALGDMDEAIAIAPDAPRLRLARAYAYLALGKPTRAVGDARVALKMEPDMPAGYLVRARAYLATSKFARAGADAARAVELAPGDRRAWDTATIAYTELARFDDALAAADRLVELAPSSANGLNARCWVLALKPDPAAAMPSCDAALAADDRHYQAYDSRAFANWQLGRIEDAKADLAKAAAIAPDVWDWSSREDRFTTVLARRYLKGLGLYAGPLDGAFEDLSDTEKAIRAFQSEAGLPETGEASADLLEKLAKRARID